MGPGGLAPFELSNIVAGTSSLRRRPAPLHVLTGARALTTYTAGISTKVLLVKMKRAWASHDIYFSVFTSQIARESISDDLHVYVESKIFLGGLAWGGGMLPDPPRWCYDTIRPVFPLLIGPSFLQTLDPPLKWVHGISVTRTTILCY